MNPLIAALASRFATLDPGLLAIYQDLHRHPELPMLAVASG